ncbi:MAG: hypothetical protein AAGK09_13160 [Planctomycetota bacterium]
MSSHTTPCMRIKRAVGVAAVLALAAPALALEIDGVQPAALDQPRVTMTLRQTAGGEPIVGEGVGGMAGMQAEMLKELLDDPALQDLGIGEAIGQLAGGGGAGAFTAFLDTGASGVMIAGSQAAAMGLEYERSDDGRRVTFEDVGVGGAEEFAVTTPLFVDLGTFAGGEIGEHMRGPFRLQVKPGGGMLENLTGPINLAGMPLMVRRVMVMDASGMSDLELLKTSLLPPGHPDVPRPDANTITVPLTYVDFAGFTRTIPASADPPNLAPSPMIGPDPVTPNARGGDPDPIHLRHFGQDVAGSWLLDTGAVASILSEKHAKAIGVTVRPDGSGLDGPGTDEQFTLPIGGVGGIKNVHGFFIERLEVPTAAGEPLVYRNAPVLVLDITITHPQTGREFTLDGVFGMNYLVASAHVSTGGGGGVLGMPTIGDIRDTPFRHAVIDHAAQRMHLQPAHLD